MEAFFKAVEAWLCMHNNASEFLYPFCILHKSRQSQLNSSAAASRLEEICFSADACDLSVICIALNLLYKGINSWFYLFIIKGKIRHVHPGNPAMGAILKKGRCRDRETPHMSTWMSNSCSAQNIAPRTKRLNTFGETSLMYLPLEGESSREFCFEDSCSLIKVFFCVRN